MYDIYAYLELVREYCTMRKPFCVNGVGLLMYRTSSGHHAVLLYKVLMLLKIGLTIKYYIFRFTIIGSLLNM